MLPRFVRKADELALDFDLWCEVVLHNFQSDLSADLPLRTLAAIFRS